MKTTKVTRFICDHCGRGRSCKRAMKRHELNCFLNPNRVCQFCADEGLEQIAPASLYNVTMEGGGAEDLRQLTKCPMCIMATIKRSQFHFRKELGAEEAGYVKFDYDKEMAAFRDAKYPPPEIAF